MHFIIDQAGVVAQRTPLGGSFQVGLAVDAILEVRQFVGQCAHHLDQHDADVGLQAILPVGIALAGEVEQGAAETVEVTRLVVDRKIDPFLRRARRVFRFAIQVAGASGLEAEGDVIEVAIDGWAVDPQRVERKVRPASALSGAAQCGYRSSVHCVPSPALWTALRRRPWWNCK